MKIFGWIVGIIVFLIVFFNIMSQLLCTRDSSVKDVALPLATVIVKHIEKNGVPDSLKDIKEIPYELKNCEKNTYKEDSRDGYFDIEDREKCNFNIKDKSYILKIEHDYDDKNIFNRYVYIYIEHHKTEYRYKIYYDKKIKKWKYEDYPDANVYYDWDSWVCNPKLFRLTD
jgi:hypothetical protein